MWATAAAVNPPDSRERFDAQRLANNLLQPSSVAAGFQNPDPNSFVSGGVSPGSFGVNTPRAAAHFGTGLNQFPSGISEQLRGAPPQHQPQTDGYAPVSEMRAPSGVWREWNSISRERMESRRVSCEVAPVLATVSLLKLYQRTHSAVHARRTKHALDSDEEHQQQEHSRWVRQPVRCVLTKPSEPAHNDGYDNAEHDYILHVNDVISAAPVQTCVQDALNSETRGIGVESAPLWRDRSKANAGAVSTYLVKEMLGTGTFGQVVKCVHLETREVVAVKLIKNLPAYFRQAWMEVYILEMVQRRAREIGATSSREKDGHARSSRHALQTSMEQTQGLPPLTLDYMIQLKGFFVFRQHLCLVFDKLGMNLFELIKKNGYSGFPLRLVREYTKQILSTLAVLEELKIIHCDLKPENILVDTLWCYRCDGAGDAGAGVDVGEDKTEGVSDEACPRCLHPRPVKVIDFGSACWENEVVHTYVQSRFYRAPEVLLNAPYSTKIDVWSLGCVACELFLGLPLFPGHSEHNMMCRMVEMLGEPPPELLLRSKHADKYFHRDPLGGHELKPEPASESNGSGAPSSWKRYFKHRYLRDILMTSPVREGHEIGGGDVPIGSGTGAGGLELEYAERRCFVDFVTGLLQLDPDKRLSAAEAQQHPFVRGLVLPVDQAYPQGALAASPLTAAHEIPRQDRCSFNTGVLVDQAPYVSASAGVGGVVQQATDFGKGGSLSAWGNCNPSTHVGASQGGFGSREGALLPRAETRTSSAVENEMNVRALLAAGAPITSFGGVPISAASSAVPNTEQESRPGGNFSFEHGVYDDGAAGGRSAWANEYEHEPSAIGDYRVAELNKRYSTALKQILARDETYARREQFEHIERYMQAVQSSPQTDEALHRQQQQIHCAPQATAACLTSFHASSAHREQAENLAFRGTEAFHYDTRPQRRIEPAPPPHLELQAEGGGSSWAGAQFDANRGDVFAPAASQPLSQVPNSPRSRHTAMWNLNSSWNSFRDASADDLVVLSAGPAQRDPCSSRQLSYDPRETFALSTSAADNHIRPNLTMPSSFARTVGGAATMGERGELVSGGGPLVWSPECGEQAGGGLREEERTPPWMSRAIPPPPAQSCGPLERHRCIDT